MEMQPAPSEPDAQSQEVADYRPILNEMVSLGAELSRIIVQRAAAEAPTPVAEAAIAFDRVTTGMRRTILLLRHLEEPVKPSAARHRVDARKRILREVEDAIDGALDNRAMPIAEAEKAELRVELLERLDSPDTEDDITGRPVEDVIRDICRDLSVRHDAIRYRGRRRTPADIEALHARAAKPRGEPTGPRPRNSDPPDRHQDDDMPELMSLNDIILRHVADATPGFPAHDSGQSPRAGPL